MSGSPAPVAELASLAASIGGPAGLLAEEEVTAFIGDQLAAQDLDGRSVCLLIPDGTRSCPLPTLLDAVSAQSHVRCLHSGPPAEGGRP